MNKELILNRLDKSVFYQEFVPSLKVNGKPEALGLCPFHDDHSPSLSVNLESGLFRCLACDAKGDIFTFYQKHKGVDFPTALREIGAMAGVADTNIKPKVVAKFEYKDENGKTLYIKERLEPGRNGRNKEFVFKHLENGKWTLGRGCNPVLYNLPGVMKSKNVIVVEGEAKADLMNSWGLVGTCLDSGANSPWKDEYLKAFEGKEKVVILPDNDTPGKQYASKIASALHGKVSTLNIIELPGLGEAEDVIDWSKIPGNNIEKLIELVKNTPQWTPKEDVKHNSTTFNSTMVLTRLDSLFQEPEETVTWLVDGLLPSGGFSILVAKPKVGKTETAKNLAYNIASNNLFLNRSVNPGAVIYLALEEKRSEIKKHFRAMGATGNEEIYIYAGGAPVDAIKQITSVVESLKPVLLIIDPLFRLVKLKDGNDYVQVTNALEPLLRLARDSGTHVLCVHHSPKGERNAEDSPLGSQAIFGSVDTLMIMKRYEGYRTIQTIQRYGSDMEEIVLEYNPETRSITVGGTKQEQDICWVEEAIIDFLSKQTEPVTEKVINDEVEGRTALKRKALRELIKQGEIVRSGRGGKGDPYRYSCSLESVCSELGNESGNNKNNQKNDQEKNTCSLVPDVWREQVKKKDKIADTLGGCKEDSCSHIPVFTEPHREQANLTKNEGEIEQKNFDELCEFFEKKRIEN